MQQLFSLFKKWVRSCPSILIFLFLVVSFSLFILSLWSPGVFDAFFYHQQFIRWNEEYSVVPGLANLEDRFGFNSGYLLVSALFTFSSFFGEAVYTLTPLLALLLVYWVFSDILKSHFKASRLILLGVFSLFFLLFAYTVLTTTSTDIVPSLIIFYLACYFVLHPDRLDSKPLLLVLLPAMLITYRISIAPFCIVSIYTLYIIIKKKEYSQLFFFFIAGIVIILPWLVRNVVISGYLIYPFYQLDLFNVDWKVPVQVAIEQVDFIKYCGQTAIEEALVGFVSLQPHSFISSVMYIIIACSPFIFLYKLIRRRLTIASIVIYVSLLAVVVLWLFNAPDPRFISGTLLAITFITLYTVLPISLGGVELRKASFFCMAMFALLLAVWAVRRSYGFYESFKAIDGDKSLSKVLYTPYSYKNQMEAVGIATDSFAQFELNNGLIIYLGQNDSGGRPVVYDRLPATVAETGWTSKFQDISTIEARGATLQDGFRPKSRK